tara:strand:- start:374 stop:607 length:234 start_codon:yes stop_codon:yes gene_type:complete
MNNENNPHPLQAEYDAWLKNNVPASMLTELGGGICAWELMAYIGNEDPSDFGGWALTQAQYDWLADFCNRWDAIENS